MPSSAPSLKDAKKMAKSNSRRLDPSAVAPEVEVISERLAAKVLGQASSLEELVKCYTRFRAGLAPEGKPVGFFLLVGPTGSGKSHVATKFAQEITGKKTAPLRIDCAEFCSEHEVSKLLGCFVSGTPVLMADGSRKPIEEVSIGDLVMSGQGLAQPVEDTYEYACDGEILQLKVAGNNEPICVTKGHMVWAKRGWDRRPTTRTERDPSRLYTQEGFSYMAAGDLRKGDVLCYPRLKTNPYKYQDVLDLGEFASERVCRTYNGPVRAKDLARIAGYYVSEGGCNKSHNTLNFTFGLAETDLVADLQAALKAIGFKSRIQHRESSLRVYVSGVALASAFAEWFGDRVDRKRIPEWLLHAPDGIVWEFLDAAIMGDGGKTVRRRVDYTTVSQTLASQMELLIRRLGFASQLQKHPPPRPGWRARYRLYVSGAQLPKFVLNLRFVSQIVKVEFDTDQRQSQGIQRNQGADQDYIYTRILSVKEVQYRGAVHDFSVAQDNSYVLSFRAHNSPPG